MVSHLLHTAQPIKHLSRVPRYQNPKLFGGSCKKFFKPSTMWGKVWLGVGTLSYMSARLCRLLPSGRKKEGRVSCRKF